MMVSRRSYTSSDWVGLAQAIKHGTEESRVRTAPRGHEIHGLVKTVNWVCLATSHWWHQPSCLVFADIRAPPRAPANLYPVGPSGSFDLDMSVARAVRNSQTEVVSRELVEPNIVDHMAIIRVVFRPPAHNLATKALLVSLTALVTHGEHGYVARQNKGLVVIHFLCELALEVASAKAKRTSLLRQNPSTRVIITGRTGTALHGSPGRENLRSQQRTIRGEGLVSSTLKLIKLTSQ